MGLKKREATLPVAVAVSDRQILLVDLRSGAPAVRRDAARALGALGEGQALCEQLEREGDAAVRQALLAVLGRHADPQIGRRLLQLLRSEDAELRAAVGETLAGLPDVLASCLADALADADSDFRILTVTAIAGMAHAQVPAWLLEVVECDAHPNVVAAALEGLGECGGADALPALRAARQRFPGNRFLGFLFDETIRRIGQRGPAKS